MVRICQLVAGMPLAIELAAAWLHQMSCAEIVSGLAKNLDLLAAEWRDLPARHRSLRAVFNHSWQFLSAEEKVVLQNLSIFAGGFDRQAAEVVAGAKLAHLSALVDKSMVRRTQAGRYELHELLRQFTSEKLEYRRPSEIERIRHQHCYYYTTFLNGLSNDLKGDGQQASMEKIAIDIDNIRASWRWAIERGNVEAIQLAQESLGLYYNMQGMMQEGQLAFSRAVARFSKPSESTDDANRELSSQERIVLGYLLATLGQFCVYLGLFEEGQTHLQKSISLLRRTGPRARRELALALRHIGELYALQGRSITITQQHFEESLTIFTDIEDQWGMIETLLELGILAHERPTNYTEAERYLQKCVGVCQQMGERKIRAFAVMCLGRVAMDRGEYVKARQLMQEGLEMFQKLGVPMGIAYSRRDLGVLQMKIGSYEQAEQNLRESMVISQEMGDRRGEAVCLNILGNVACFLANYKQAEQLHQECLIILNEIGQRGYRFDCLIRLGRVAFDQGQYERAKHLYEEGLAGAKQLMFRYNMACSLNYLGQINCLLGKVSHPNIRPYFSEALQISSKIQSDPLSLEILVGLALCLSRHESAEKEHAVEILSLAQGHTASTQDTRDRAKRLLAELGTDLSPEIVIAAIRRGQSRDLQATIEALHPELSK